MLLFGSGAQNGFGICICCILQREFTFATRHCANVIQCFDEMGQLFEGNLRPPDRKSAVGKFAGSVKFLQIPDGDIGGVVDEE